MECKKCKTPMHKRGKKNMNIPTQVYICPKCGTILYVWQDGTQKWE